MPRTDFGFPSTPSPSGFSAEVFQKGGEIVISFQGTNSDPFTSDGIKDWWTNGQLALGWTNKQLNEAALLYQRVKAANPTAEISFTGHSLGGGLAGLMSIYFNKPATIFAPAPFEATASVSVAQTLRSVLEGAGFSDGALNAIASATGTGKNGVRVIFD